MQLPDSAARKITIPALVIPDASMARIEAIARYLRLDFIRVYGSALVAIRTARDVDFAVGCRPLDVEELDDLRAALEEAFQRPADVVQLRSGLSPLLVREIAAHSQPLFESAAGRARYAELIDRLFAVAEDELLAYPIELRDEALRAARGRLDVP